MELNALEVFATAALVLQLGSLAAAGRVLSRVPATLTGPRPAITVLRPVSGLENKIAETLTSTFATDLSGPVQIVFCVQRADDPVVPLVQRLIDTHPQFDASLLVGDDRVTANPKLNNLHKGWLAARHALVLMVDSNVLLPQGYLDRLAAEMQPSVGLVTSPPVGIRPESAAAHLEAAFLNTYDGRWQLASEAIGNGFAQGKILFWRREILDAAGGLTGIAHDMAEDIAATKLVRAAGLKVRLLNDLWPQPLGARSFRAVWNRQLRWSRVRRMGVPGYFMMEPLSGPALPMLAVLALGLSGTTPWPLLLAYAAIWYGAEWAFLRWRGWPARPIDAAMLVLRDLLILPLWVTAWLGNGFDWQGHAMHRSDLKGRSR